MPSSKQPTEQFSLPERLQLLSILPQEGNLVTIRIVAKLREDLSFSEEEIKKAGITWDGPRVSWKKPLKKEFHIWDTARAIVRESLEKLEKESKLTEGLLPLYERFVK